MTNAPMRCASCGMPMASDDVFCGDCGKERAAAAGAPPAEPEPTPSKPPSREVRDTTPSAVAELPSLPPGRSGNCEDLALYVNVNRVFVERMEMPFQFRIRPLRDGIAQLSIEIRRGDETVARDEPAWEWAPLSEMDIPIGYRPDPGSYGKVTFRVRIAYLADGARCRVSNNVFFTIYRAQERASKVLESLRIDITNNVSADRAGDARVSTALDGMVEKFRARPDDPIADFNLYDTPEIWAPLALWREVPDDPPSVPHLRRNASPLEAVRGRLSLRMDRWRLHLLSNTVTQIGRSSDSDIVARISTPPALARSPDNPNLRLSRFHCRIAVENDRCRLIDRAWNPRERQMKPSRHGTFFEGRRIMPSGGAADVPHDTPVRIALTEEGADAFGGYTFDAHLWCCGDLPRQCRCDAPQGADRQPACLWLRPRRHPKRAYLLLWERADLGRQWPEWKDFCLCRCREAFRMACGGECRWLVPGERFKLGGKAIEVSEYDAKAAASES